MQNAECRVQSAELIKEKKTNGHFKDSGRGI